MNREQFFAALRSHQFETHGIEVEFQTMNGCMMPHPYPDPEYPYAVLTAGTRKITMPLIEEVISEVQRDLDLLKKLHPEIKRYGIWYWQLPGENDLPKNQLRYGKASAK